MGHKTVLIVEHSLTIKEKVSSTYTDAGFEILESSGGIDTINTLRRNQVDIIVVGVNLYDIEGSCIVHLVRSQPCLQNIPIIAVTPESFFDDKKKTNRAKNIANITKGCTNDQLIELTHNLINGTVFNQTIPKTAQLAAEAAAQPVACPK